MHRRLLALGALGGRYANFSFHRFMYSSTRLRCSDSPSDDSDSASVRAVSCDGSGAPAENFPPLAPFEETAASRAAEVLRAESNSSSLYLWRRCSRPPSLDLSRRSSRRSSLDLSRRSSLDSLAISRGVAAIRLDLAVSRLTSRAISRMHISRMRPLSTSTRRGGGWRATVPSTTHAPSPRAC